MKSQVRVTPAVESDVDLLAVAVCEVNGRLPGTLSKLDGATGGEVKRLIATKDFAGKQEEQAVLYPKNGPTRVLLLGLGPADGVKPAAIRRAVAMAGRKAIAVGAAKVGFRLGEDVPRRACAAELLGTVAVEGAAHGSWAFEDLRSEPDTRGTLDTFVIFADEKDKADVDRGRKRGDAIAAGHLLARKLQQLPGNHCPPKHLAKVARDLGKRHGFSVTVLNREQMVKEGMNALLAVAQGSVEPPHLIVIEYKGGGKGAPICLVGKGVTFDSGGISIKPAQKMEDMKYDMSGAAAVLGTMETIGLLKPKVNVVTLVPTTENLPSGTAIKPGDVVKTHFGKTVEIINTDAEGRLILSDALSYARRYKPACILDAATLTGAVVIGLGNFAIGLMGNDEKLIDDVKAAGEEAGERCWPLPLWDEYRKLIKSDTADIKNSGGRAAGTITAGWFLREFVEEGTPWAHLDIAGTAYTDTESSGQGKGPTGIGVRLFSHFILGRASG